MFFDDFDNQFLHGLLRALGEWKSGVGFLFTFPESKVLAKPDNEENMKEESTPLYGVNSLKRRVSIIEIELPDSTLSTPLPVRVHKTYASPSAHGRRFGSGKVTENL